MVYGMEGGVLVGVLEGAGLGFLPYSPPEESPQDNSDRFGKMNRINIMQKRQVQGRPHPVAGFGGVKAGRGHRDVGQLGGALRLRVYV